MTDNLAQAVPVHDMANLMQQDRQDFLVILRQLDQFIGDDDGTVRQGKGIGADKTTAPELQPVTDPGAVPWHQSAKLIGQLLVPARLQRGCLEYPFVQSFQCAATDVTI